MQIVNIQHHISKSRVPLEINETYQYFIGEAEGTRINTSCWGRLRNWYYQNRNKPILRLVAVCEDLQQSH